MYEYIEYESTLKMNITSTGTYIYIHYVVQVIKCILRVYTIY